MTTQKNGLRLSNGPRTCARPKSASETGSGSVMGNGSVMGSVRVSSPQQHPGSPRGNHWLPAGWWIWTWSGIEPRPTLSVRPGPWSARGCGSVRRHESDGGHGQTVCACRITWPLEYCVITDKHCHWSRQELLNSGGSVSAPAASGFVRASPYFPFILGVTWWLWLVSVSSFSIRVKRRDSGAKSLWHDLK